MLATILPPEVWTIVRGYLRTHRTTTQKALVREMKDSGFTATLRTPIFQYDFALHNDLLEPTGAINMSRLNDLVVYMNNVFGYI